MTQRPFRFYATVMDFFADIILGVIQGLTEFLPVSSSGHLAAGQLLMQRLGTEASLAADSMMFEVLLHLATLLAVVIFYRREALAALVSLPRIFRALPAGTLRQCIDDDEDARRLLAIAVATVPTAILGLLLRHWAGAAGQHAAALGGLFLLCAVMLAATRFAPIGTRALTMKAALLIGIVQGLAVFPGISRSGATIACALALGIPREEAARFSFLLSIPAILGAAVFEVQPAALLEMPSLAPLLLGTLAAFLVGLAALRLLVYIVRRGHLWSFAPYVALVGLACVVFL
ncbi:MAG: undecaprenyl-diphosphate phosphatase [Myxococcales bacterium]|nr:undecaprenyl-diphosphate phosphatase [Myxococcales bacterium]